MNKTFTINLQLGHLRPAAQQAIDQERPIGFDIRSASWLANLDDRLAVLIKNLNPGIFVGGLQNLQPTAQHGSCFCIIAYHNGTNQLDEGWIVSYRLRIFLPLLAPHRRPHASGG